MMETGDILRLAGVVATLIAFIGSAFWKLVRHTDGRLEKLERKMTDALADTVRLTAYQQDHEHLWKRLDRLDEKLDRIQSSLAAVRPVP